MTKNLVYDKLLDLSNELSTQRDIPQFDIEKLAANLAEIKEQYKDQYIAIFPITQVLMLGDQQIEPIFYIMGVREETDEEFNNRKDLRYLKYESDRKAFENLRKRHELNLL